MTKKQITMYTDGACTGNPGPGGYAVLLRYNGKEKELSGGFSHTTNNRMEILAVITGLEALTEPCNVAIYSDSRYVVDAVTKGWASRWQAYGWKLKKDGKQPALNPDLWERLLAALARHEVEMQWVRGHGDDKDNNRVDRLAVKASQQKELPSDPGYSG